MNCNLKLAMGSLGLAGVLALNPLSAAMKPGEYLNGQWSTVPDGDRGITFTYLKNDDGSGSLFGATFGYDSVGEDYLGDRARRFPGKSVFGQWRHFRQRGRHLRKSAVCRLRRQISATQRLP